ncbi:three-Cys-motif partner protein TcmP [Candidatus Omnitrophota bacterium]
MSDEGNTIASDGYIAIEFGPWAEDKLSHLEKYCAIFNTATHKQWKNRVYIDLFSGPGKCVRKGTKKEFNGSPLLALNCAIPFTHYYFNDIRSDYIEALKKRTCSYGYDINYINQDCNIAVDEILHKVPKYSICFAYIDPYYLEIKFDTIRKLTITRAVDLLITFQIGMARRNFFQPNFEMKQFSPPNVDWKEFPRDVIKGGRISTRPVLDAYEGGLIELGYPKSNMIDDVLERNARNAPLYYLIFASKHKLGAQLYSGVISRKDSIHRKML